MKNQEKTVDLIINATPRSDNTRLQKGINYSLTIADACVVDKTLKVCFEISDDEHQDVLHIIEYFRVDSKEYFNFIKTIYTGDDSDVINVKLADFDRFRADCSADVIKDGGICWNAVSIWSSPLSSNWLSKHQND